MTEICKVVKVKRKLVYIELNRSDKCNGCEICSFNNKKSITVPASCDIYVSAGQTVKVQMPTKSVGAGSLLIYAVPILLMLIGALIGLAGGMWLQIGLCAAGLALGLVAAYLIDRLYRRAPDVLPKVVEICEPNNADNASVRNSETDNFNGGTNESRHD